jgi:hypothetical protein
MSTVGPKRKPNVKPQDRPWEDREDPGWLRAVLKLPKEETPVDVTYVGPCPNCLHELRVEVPRPLEISDAFRESTGKEPTTDFDGRCRCNCAEGHPPKTEEHPDGCGVYAYAYIPR